MGVEIHSRALVAMDHLEPRERELLLRALDSFAADMASGGVSPHTALESNGVWWLRVSPSLRAVLRRSEVTPTQFEVLDIVRPEALTNYAVNRDPFARAAEA